MIYGVEESIRPWTLIVFFLVVVERRFHIRTFNAICFLFVCLVFACFFLFLLACLFREKGREGNGSQWNKRSLLCLLLEGEKGWSGDMVSCVCHIVKPTFFMVDSKNIRSAVCVR